MKTSFSLAAVIAGGFLSKTVLAWEETCTQFKDIYADGTELCEKMWDDSFKVVDDSEPGYSMWFFDTDQNPNDDVTTAIFGEGSQPDTCFLKYYHKDAPSAEDDNMSECHPWKNSACCDSTTVESARALNEAYGEGYEWDRCGPMSDACQRFFVQEACLYECEPSAGLYRKYKDPSEEDYNEWQLFEMPIKKSYCDAWFDACRNDYFCGQGSFFECEAFYWANLKEAEDSKDKENTGLIIGLSIAGAAAVIGILFAVFLIRKERKGSPMFAPSEQMTEGVST